MYGLLSQCITNCLNLQWKKLALPIYITTRFQKKFSLPSLHFLHLPQILSPHLCHDLQVLRKLFPLPLLITMGKLLYRLTLCFYPRQVRPSPFHTQSTASHSSHHFQYEHVIHYKVVTCSLEEHDVKKKEASHIKGSDRESYCQPLFQLVHILANGCCILNTVDAIVGYM